MPRKPSIPLFLSLVLIAASSCTNGRNEDPKLPRRGVAALHVLYPIHLVEVDGKSTFRILDKHNDDHVESYIEVSPGSHEIKVIYGDFLYHPSVGWVASGPRRSVYPLTFTIRAEARRRYLVYAEAWSDTWRPLIKTVEFEEIKREPPAPPAPAAPAADPAPRVPPVGPQK